MKNKILLLLLPALLFASACSKTTVKSSMGEMNLGNAVDFSKYLIEVVGKGDVKAFKSLLSDDLVKTIGKNMLPGVMSQLGTKFTDLTSRYGSVAKIPVGMAGPNKLKIGDLEMKTMQEKGRLYIKELPKM